MKKNILLFLILFSLQWYGQNKNCSKYYFKDKSEIIDTIFKCSENNYYIELKHGEVSPVLFGYRDKSGYVKISNFIYLVNLKYFDKKKYDKYEVFLKYDKIKDVVIIKTINSFKQVNYQEYEISEKMINEKYLQQK